MNVASSKAAISPKKKRERQTELKRKERDALDDN